MLGDVALDGGDFCEQLLANLLLPLLTSTLPVLRDELSDAARLEGQTEAVGPVGPPPVPQRLEQHLGTSGHRLLRERLGVAGGEHPAQPGPIRVGQVPRARGVLGRGEELSQLPLDEGAGLGGSGSRSLGLGAHAGTAPAASKRTPSSQTSVA